MRWIKSCTGIERIKISAKMQFPTEEQQISIGFPEICDNIRDVYSGIVSKY